MASADGGSVDCMDVPPVGFVVEKADDSRLAGPTLEPAGRPHPVMQDAESSNEVQLPVEQFAENWEDLVLFAHSVAHGLTEEALSDLLKLSVCKARYRTPYLMGKRIQASVNVDQRHLEACRKGCAAFTHKRKEHTACDAFGAAWYEVSGRPVKQVTYWPLTVWLSQMRSDPVLGPALRKGMRTARSEAHRNGDFEQKRIIHDSYHGMTLLETVRAGLFAENTETVSSLSTDGFEALCQRGFHGWPIIATALNLSPGMRTRNICQIVISRTPGTKQPADLESFLHTLVEELNFLAKGLPGVRVSGSPNSVTMRANVVQITGYMPAIEKLLNVSRHIGVSPGRHLEYHGVYHGPIKHTFFLPTDLTDPITVLFSVDNFTAPRRTADSISRDAAATEEAQSIGL